MKQVSFSSNFPTLLKILFPFANLSIAHVMAKKRKEKKRKEKSIKVKYYFPLPVAAGSGARPPPSHRGWPSHSFELSFFFFNFFLKK
jgi:hypothetical protein